MNTLKFINPDTLSVSSEQMKLLYPYLSLFFGILALIVISGFKFLNKKPLILGVTTISLLLSTVFSAQFFSSDSVTLFSGMMVSDSYSHFFNFLFSFVGIATIFMSIAYLEKENLFYTEYFILILFSVLGMMLLTASLNFIVLFVALEIMSLSVYLLVGFRRADRKSNEASMKYFILGSAASAVLLYGCALLYGATGLMSITDILKMVKETQILTTSPLFTLGCLLMFVGFLFKVATIPFHMWMPDVYEGAPTPVTGFMATGIKAASFAIFIRVFMMSGYGSTIASEYSHHFKVILSIIAVLTMFLANVIALTQTSLKRMLAYSSIAHSGYILLGMIAAPYSEYGFAPIIFYLVSYTVMSLGAFGILTILSGKGDTDLTIHHLSGLSKSNPWLSFAMAIFVFSMAGIPPTAGFASKYFLLYSAVQAKMIPLVIVAVLCSAISVYYYLRVLVYLYMKEENESAPKHKTPFYAAFIIAVMSILTIQVGLSPTKIVDFTKKVIAQMN